MEAMLMDFVAQFGSELIRRNSDMENCDVYM